MIQPAEERPDGAGRLLPTAAAAGGGSGGGGWWVDDLFLLGRACYWAGSPKRDGKMAKKQGQ